MPSTYWIKLYLEILDDPKMATLPDRLWRRIIELFLCAGRLGGTGELPDTVQLAWVFRLQIDELDMDLKQIASIGIIQKTNTGWFVTKFASRQAPIPASERMRQQRERIRKSQYYMVDVTDQLRNVTQINRLTESETEKKEGSLIAPLILQFGDQTPQECERLYQKITGQISIPSNQRANAMSDLEAILAHYGPDNAQAVREGISVFQKWCSSKGKSGRPYSRINVGWLSWWLDGIAPIPATLPVISIPSPNILCGDGERYKRQAENHQGNSRFAEALSEYKTHLETCAVCGRGSNVIEVTASIESLVGKWTK